VKRSAIATVFPPAAAGPDLTVLNWIERAESQRRAKHTGLYGPNGTGQFSWFADLFAAAEYDARAWRALESPVARGDASKVAHDPPPPGRASSIDEVRSRLAAAAQSAERRDLTSAFNPSGAPNFVAHAFSVAARTKARIAPLLPEEPLPDTIADGKLQVPRFTTGATAAVQASEGANVSQTDPATALYESPYLWWDPLRRGLVGN
jgi:hypothetical protein